MKDSNQYYEPLIIVNDNSKLEKYIILEMN
jgi:hypothetical protein